MANPLKTITAFIEAIPDQAFFRGRPGSWYRDQNMRLDLQGYGYQIQTLTAAGPDQAYNVQVQALILVKGDTTLDQIRQALIDGIIADLKG
ncbi:MAG: hypothetical protein M1826_001466 [Phylliscum demangeonii]|nr:MAG: hypothetical protein M1826_001466 [Phylliscum demangeonii]